MIFSVFAAVWLLYPYLLSLIWEYLKHGAGSSYVLQVLLCCSLGTITCQKGLALSDLELFFKALSGPVLEHVKTFAPGTCEESCEDNDTIDLIPQVKAASGCEKTGPTKLISLYCYTFKLGCPLITNSGNIKLFLCFFFLHPQVVPSLKM